MGRVEILGCTETPSGEENSRLGGPTDTPDGGWGASRVEHSPVCVSPATFPGGFLERVLRAAPPSCGFRTHTPANKREAARAPPAQGLRGRGLLGCLVQLPPTTLGKQGHRGPERALSYPRPRAVTARANAVGGRGSGAVPLSPFCLFRHRTVLKGAGPCPIASPPCCKHSINPGLGGRTFLITTAPSRASQK